MAARNGTGKTSGAKVTIKAAGKKPVSFRPGGLHQSLGVPQGQPIPDILLSGDHGKIAAWRRSEAERLTKERRPDLWTAFLQRPHEPPKKG